MKRKQSVFVALGCALLLFSCGGNGPSSVLSSANSVEESSSVENSVGESSPAPDSSEQQNKFDKSLLNDNVILHYHRTDGAYDTWAMWMWADGVDGAEYLINGYDDYGAVFAYPLSTFFTDVANAKLGFIVKSKGSWDKKDPDPDRFLTLSTMTPDSNGNYEAWLWTGVTTVYASEPSSPFSITSLSFTDFKTIRLESQYGTIASYEVLENNEVILNRTVEGSSDSFDIVLDNEITLGNVYAVRVTLDDGSQFTSNVDLSALYQSEQFTDRYEYDGDDLGATYTSEKTTFKVWSPFASKIVLRIYENGTPVSIDKDKGSDACTETEMVRGEKGVFSAEMAGELGGKYYTYVVYSNVWPDGHEIVDPYAKSAGVDGLRGMVVDFSKTNPDGWDEYEKALPYDRKELTVYETHVRDITSSSTWGGSEANAKKFLGLSETGTTYTEGDTTVKTGFDHIRDLGVNAVQLQPIFDQANDEVKNDFNWGYNPLNYNVLEGGYSSDPYDGYSRIREFKSVVKSYLDNGINIIMDVVYNHVNSVNGQNFDTLAPGYFFRYTSDGGLSNGSGCGNETASENTMFRKFMEDSTSFWLKEYKLGGFRFDLMALHDLDTMNGLTAKLKEINPNVCVYGEPWTGGSTTLSGTKQASQANLAKYEGYGQFNDGMRDALVKSGMSGYGESGFVTGSNATVQNIASGIIGRTHTSSTYAATDPDKTVNYVSCHDNFTLYDRFTAYAETNGLTIDDSTKEKMNVLANSFVFTSQGTSFMLAGEEMLRSKGKDLSIAHNSYNAGDEVNQLDYSNLVKYPEMNAAYKKLIALKQDNSAFHLGADEVKALPIYKTAGLMKITASDNHEFVYEFPVMKDGASVGTVKVAHANDPADGTSLDPVDFEGYELYLDTLSPESSSLELTSSTPIQPYQTVVGIKMNS